MIGEKTIKEWAKQFVALGGTPEQLQAAKKDNALMMKVIRLLEDHIPKLPKPESTLGSDRERDPNPYILVIEKGSRLKSSRGGHQRGRG